MKIIRKILLFLSIAFLAGFCLFVYFSPDVSNGFAEVVNKTDEVLEFLEVRVCKSFFQFSNLSPESSVGFAFPVDGESGYLLRIQTASGKSLETEVGYVTRGLDCFDKIIILPDEVVIERLEVKNGADSLLQRQP